MSDNLTKIIIALAIMLMATSLTILKDNPGYLWLLAFLFLIF